MDKSHLLQPSERLNELEPQFPIWEMEIIFSTYHLSLGDNTRKLSVDKEVNQ